MSPGKYSPVPNTPTGPLRALCSIRNHALFFAFVPGTLLKTTVSYFLGHFPEWEDFPTALQIQAIKLFCWAHFTLSLPPPHASEWDIPKPMGVGAAKARNGVRVGHVVLPPVDESLRRDVAAVAAAVRAVERPAWMLTPDEEGHVLAFAGKGERVVLYLHAGAYIIGHPLESHFAWSVSRELDVRVLAVNYRKTLDATTAHPAPLLDVLAGYLYLLDHGFEPENIVFLGDSAGGHLCLMLICYLALIDKPLPGRMALVSPWCDMTAGNGIQTFPSQATKYKYDFIPYLSDLSIPSGMRHYPEATKRSPFFSPVLATHDEWAHLRAAGVKVHIMVGTKELLADEVAALASHMKSAGVDVQLREDVDGLHIGPVMRWKGSNAWQLWLKDMRQFLQP